MAYFSKFPTIDYDFNINGFRTTKRVIDITYIIRFLSSVLASNEFFEYYDIIEGETIDIIAEKIYGSPELHWVIMLANQRYNYVQDYPLSSYSLDKHIKNTYADRNAINHYVDNDGIIVSPDTAGAIPITNEEHEIIENDKKRRIKIPNQSLITQMLTEHSDLI